MCEKCISEVFLNTQFWRLKVQDGVTPSVQPLVRAFWLYDNLVDVIMMGACMRERERKREHSG
jgi:hypothetical protein